MSQEAGSPAAENKAEPWGKNGLVEFEEGIAWVSMNRPEKRNAMSPALNEEMLATLDVLEADERCGVIVLTGKGDAFTSGMDLKEYFRETDNKPNVHRMRTFRTAFAWQWHKLLNYYKPTIAMVNGWCFGGAFTPMIACDMAIAADDAVLGISEINWGIIPGGNVSKFLAMVMNQRKALYYIMTGKQFSGKEAEALGVVTESVPRAQGIIARLANKAAGEPGAIRCRFFRVLGSAAGDPARLRLGKEAEFKAEGTRTIEAAFHQSLDRIAYREIILGFRIESGVSRFNTHEEIRSGVIEAIERDLPESIVGVVTPWEMNPRLRAGR